MLAAKLGPKEVITWNIGDKPISEKLQNALTAYLSVEVMVYGPELNYIKANFRGLPYAANRDMQVWYDAHAKFIIGNLK